MAGRGLDRSDPQGRRILLSSLLFSACSSGIEFGSLYFARVLRFSFLFLGGVVASSGYKYKGWEGLSELDCGVAFRLNLFFGFLN
jgi:hypothetical protein